MDPRAELADFLAGGRGLWLADGVGVAPPGCVVVATSGSTGSGRLVVLSREALLAAARSATKRLGFDATWHLALPPNYVAGLMVLVRGAIGCGVRFSGADLAELRAGAGRNVVSIVATQLHRALRDPELVARLADFDAVLVGGAALGPELRSRAEAAQVRVIETYGMSETCGGVVWDGLPLPDVAVRLADDGRIRIAGPMLFEGYHGRPDLSAAALVDGALLTNDRGHFDAERLVIDGRVDDIVISGGVNVDLQGVRAAVSALEPDTAVFAVADEEWGARVVLFAANGTLGTWRARLRDSLPPAWLPRQLVLVDPLPRTSGGKPDRGRLLSLVPR